METIKVTAKFGASLKPFSECARQMAKEHGVIVECDFNDVTVRVSANTNIGLLMRDFYNASSLGVTVIGPDCVAVISEEDRQKLEAAEAASQKKQEEQEKHASKESIRLGVQALELIVSFPEDGNQDALMRWVKRYTEAANSIYFPDEVNGWLVDKLQALGYVPNDCAGLDQAEYRKRDVVARYILGQALACIVERDLPPHLVISEFVDDYFKLRG